jgi:hypothetical protein
MHDHVLQQSHTPAFCGADGKQQAYHSCHPSLDIGTEELPDIRVVQYRAQGMPLASRIWGEVCLLCEQKSQ